eukprot:TRINITY_DN11279_c0_g1_i5.p1 TRINITY_DN11279_c0_g1~~TRINITY_DN11279_c0_g1_i5.p1  ORF type:complete len:734 (+),score=159.34 TRINITY_DN11279_c0_g1_i5:50-2251(+)
MTQWRKFQFFEREEIKDEPALAVKGLNITCCANGRGHIIFGDQSGQLHMLNRSFGMTSFPAFESATRLVYQFKKSGFLLAVGEDEDTTTSIVKLWNLEKLDKNGHPVNVRSFKILSGKYANVKPTLIAVHEAHGQLAIALENGLIVHVKGDIIRDRFTRQQLLAPESKDLVTGLEFCEARNSVFLFAATERCILCYDILNSIHPEEVDMAGCPIGACTMSEGQDFVVGRPEAVYFYEVDGRGPCFAFDGANKTLTWFRGYLVVRSQEAPGKPNVVNIYDLANKFIAYTGSFSDILYIVSEWGSVYIVTVDKKIFRVEEKDTQTKLEMLFKKNLYTVALNLAQGQQYDGVATTDIYRKYGDHLYAKGDYDSAISQYMKTIGRLEPSYVIRKFLDGQRIHNLTSYLQALHEKRLATSDHTTLLLNCYTKLKDVAKLDHFIKTGSEFHFDVETAIKVLRHAGYFDHALYLAKVHHEHDLYLRIQLEDIKQYSDALDYISELTYQEAQAQLKAHGKVLVTQLPEQTTNLLMKICTTGAAGFKRSEDANAPTTRVDAEEFIHLFVDHPEWLVRFLEFVIKYDHQSSRTVYNTLLELYLREAQEYSGASGSSEEKAISLLQNDQARYDVDHALGLAQARNFKAGVLYLYEKLKLYNEILQFHMDQNDHEQIMRACMKFGARDPNLWIQVLSYFAGKTELCHKEITEILANIDRENLLPPLLVIQVKQLVSMFRKVAFLE